MKTGEERLASLPTLGAQASCVSSISTQCKGRMQSADKNVQRCRQRKIRQEQEGGREKKKTRGEEEGLTLFIVQTNDLIRCLTPVREAGVTVV